ncbi:MAG: hypothetical protein ABT11_04060 [Novosphingobium sp. SCN 66-18]|nr:MAG: hypothetical protein ABT11_04060 [Novosphingobium sp. SCN 66-18]
MFAVGLRGEAPRLLIEGSDVTTVFAQVRANEVVIEDAAIGDFVISGDGSTLEARVIPIEEARAAAMVAVSTHFNVVLAQGCMTPKGRADCDDKAQQRITSAVLLSDKAAQLGLPEAATPWTMFDGSVEPHSRAELVALGLAIGAQMQACFARKQQLQALIGAAADRAALAAIDIEAGWPGQEG